MRWQEGGNQGGQLLADLDGLPREIALQRAEPLHFREPAVVSDDCFTTETRPLVGSLAIRYPPN